MAAGGDVRWRDVDPEGVIACVAPRLARNRPFLMSGYWAHQVLSKGAAERWKTFVGIKSVLTAHGIDQLRVDVSCTKNGDSFRGDKANRQQVNLKLMDMVEIAEAHELGKIHWAASEEIGLDFYLCQCPVVSREEGKPEVLNAIAGEFRTPSCVSEEDLLQINLWLGAMETTTNLHYDANHNLLFVLKGSKRVALLPPDMTAEVHAMPVFSESANHAGLRDAGLAALMADEEAARKGAMYIDVAEGEAVFIPEGWWHQVSSSRGTVAVNVWFKGVRPALCESPSRHMREYYLRCLVESLLADRLREAAGAGDDDKRKANVEETELPGGSRPPAIFTEASPAAPEAAPISTKRSSPLCSTDSTTKQRNAYLRAMGTDGMKQELPTVARERRRDWARLVEGLDPLTAYVLTTRWEAAGGAASMPEFYAAIFGTGESEPTTAGGDEREDVRGRPPARTAKNVAVGEGGGEGDRRDRLSTGGTVEIGGCGAGSACGTKIGGAAVGGPEGDTAMHAGFGGDAGNSAVFAGQAGSVAGDRATMVAGMASEGVGSELVGTLLPSQQNHSRQQEQRQEQRQEKQRQQQEHECHVRRQDEAVPVGAGSDGVSGVSLQERLMRLREAFAKEECRVVLNRAMGW